MFFRNFHVLRAHPVLSTIGIIGLGLLETILVSINYSWIKSPLFLDIIGTLISTAAFGVVPGMVTALTLHVSLEVLSGFSGDFLPWVLVNISSAAVFGVMIDRKLSETPFHLLTTILLITLVNSILGAFISHYLYDGITGHQVDVVQTAFAAISQWFLSAEFLSRLPLNIVDKGIAVLCAYGLHLIWFSRWEDKGMQEAC